MLTKFTVNVAVTQHDSIFKSVSLPGGISSKATEFKDLATKGDKWESPVFGIGSAKESTNIPKLGAVSRKPHNAASGGVRGGNAPTTNGTSGQFSSQVDQAFGIKGAGGANGPAGANTTTA